MSASIQELFNISDQLAKNFILQAGAVSVDDNLKFSGLNAGLNNGKSTVILWIKKIFAKRRSLLTFTLVISKRKSGNLLR